MIPDYINCNSKYVIACEFYMHSDCPETCGYAKDIKGLGIGAPVIPPREMTINLTDKLIEKDMKDY